MMTGAGVPQRLTFTELETKLVAVDPAVLLVSPRLLHRVIRMDRRIGNLGFHIPHGQTYLLPQDRLFDCVSRFELELDASRRLPEVVLLIEARRRKSSNNGPPEKSSASSGGSCFISVCIRRWSGGSRAVN